ncbi:SGNH/GDSL hydrolase family protein [Streptomyces sp. NPDC057249]|uniref:SGNH/GDSL hydrolase family protein n=1 Tax=Streptomyces sp. NPDC057249 TaxID=3346067 RepID=UPI0036290979
MMHRTRRSEAVSKRRTAVTLAALSSCALTVGFTGAASAAPQGAHGAPRSTYVALGDSYTSGPLIPTQVDADCARSDHNYPSITARERQVASFTDVSCGGATTAEMWQAQGTNGPQLDAVKRDTDLVTLQIGGNDIGFGSIISTCAGLSAKDLAGNPCQQHYRAGGYDQLTLKILRTAPKVARVLREVHKKAPHARVVVVGYPDLLPDDGTGCYPDVPFAAKDFPYLRDTEKRLNLMLRAVALLNRADYVDTYGPTVGHDMCKAPADRWIEPLRPAAPAAPAHPNAKGEEVMAQALLKTLGKGPGRH